MRYGAAFLRDPWTGRSTLLFAERLPTELREALNARWADLESILAEQSPPTTVAVTLAERLLTPARS
jgi:hypothetical protein